MQQAIAKMECNKYQSTWDATSSGRGLGMQSAATEMGCKKQLYRWNANRSCLGGMQKQRVKKEMQHRVAKVGCNKQHLRLVVTSNGRGLGMQQAAAEMG